MALAFVSGTGTIALAAGPDESPPTVQVVSTETRESRLEVRARVVDPSGPGPVLFFFKGPRDAEYRVIPMTPRGGDEFSARVPFGGGNDDRINYYIEATDRLGNGPARIGSAESPFLARPGEEVTAAPGGTSSRPTALLLLLLSLAFLFIVVLFRPRRRRKSEEYWNRLRAPHSETHEADPEPAIVDLSEPCRRSLAGATDDQIREELFWFHMLRPLVDASEEEIDKGLRLLAARRHFHPEHGWRVYGVSVLRDRLEGVCRIDPRELFDIARHLDDLPRPSKAELALF